MCIQTHKAEQALLVYTATESLSHNSQLLFSNCVTLCSAWLLKSATQMPLFRFKHNSINLWSTVSFIIYHFKLKASKRHQRNVTHSHILQLSHSLRWCHMDFSMVSHGFVLDQVERPATIIWCHVVTCATHRWFFPVWTQLKIQDCAHIWKYWEEFLGLSIETTTQWGDRLADRCFGT